MKLLWLDFETTGLTPRVDRILEFAACVSELTDPFAVGALRAGVIGGHVDFSIVHTNVLEMHQKSGLWDAVADSGLTLYEAEQQLLELVGPFVEDPAERPALAGSSVHFDLGFIRAAMPELALRLHYRVYDVSAVALFCRSLGMPRPAKNLAHRAADDIRESIAIAKSCAAWLGRGAA